MSLRNQNLPYYILMTGIVVFVIVVGFVGGMLLAGAFAGKANASDGDGTRPTGEEVVIDPTPTEPAPSATATTPTEEPSPTKTPPSPTATATPPPATATPTAVPPTPTPVPTIEYLDIFRAEGGATDRSAPTSLPMRRVEASYDNSYRDCPGGDCVRGRVQAATVAGPLTIAERLEASALVYNTFKAGSDDAELEMDVAWNGKLFAVIAADAYASVALTVNVVEIDSSGKPVKTLAGLPYTIMEREIGAGIQGVDTVDLEDSRSITVAMRLEMGKTYRVELELTCKARASFSASSTGCSFWGNGSYAEWTSMRVAFLP